MSEVDVKSLPKDDSLSTRKFCKEIAGLLRIDGERLSITKPYMTTDLRIQKTIFLDDKPVSMTWDVEEMPDLRALTGEQVVETFQDVLVEVLKGMLQ